MEAGLHFEVLYVLDTKFSLLVLIPSVGDDTPIPALPVLLGITIRNVGKFELIISIFWCGDGRSGSVGRVAVVG